MNIGSIVLEEPTEVEQPTFAMGKNSPYATDTYHLLYLDVVVDHHPHPVDDHPVVSGHCVVVDPDFGSHPVVGGPDFGVHHGSN